MEQDFPWHLVSRIGVHSTGLQSLVTELLRAALHRPPVELRQDWYY